LLRAGTLLLAMGIIVGIYLVVGKDQIQRFQEYGYFGIFLTSLIGNASIAMPIPSLFFTFMGGGTFNWVIVGLVSGAGEALGESTGYLVGYGGSFIIENRKIYKRMHYFMENHGMLTIFVLSVIPNPLIDLAGIAAGASKYGYLTVIPNPLIDLAGIAAGASKYGYLKFLVACWAGKTIKTLAFAWAGAHSVTWLLDLVNGWI
jgi:membrane protein DedA with SNARE-associated domain